MNCMKKKIFKIKKKNNKPQKTNKQNNNKKTNKKHCNCMIKEKKKAKLYIFFQSSLLLHTLL